MFVVRIGAGVVLGGAGTLASPSPHHSRLYADDTSSQTTSRKTYPWHPNQDLLSDLDLYRCIRFVSMALAIRMAIGKASFISGIDHRQAAQSG